MPPILGAGALCLAPLDSGCSNELRPPSTCQVRNRDLDVSALKPKGQESAMRGMEGSRRVAGESLKAARLLLCRPRAREGPLAKTSA